MKKYCILIALFLIAGIRVKVFAGTSAFGGLIIKDAGQIICSPPGHKVIPGRERGMSGFELPDVAGCSVQAFLGVGRQVHLAAGGQKQTTG